MVLVRLATTNLPLLSISSQILFVHTVWTQLFCCCSYLPVAFKFYHHNILSLFQRLIANLCIIDAFIVYCIIVLYCILAVHVQLRVCSNKLTFLLTCTPMKL